MNSMSIVWAIMSDDGKCVFIPQWFAINLFKVHLVIDLKTAPQKLNFVWVICLDSQALVNDQWSLCRSHICVWYTLYTFNPPRPIYTGATSILDGRLLVQVPEHCNIVIPYHYTIQHTLHSMHRNIFYYRVNGEWWNSSDKMSVGQSCFKKDHGLWNILSFK